MRRLEPEVDDSVYSVNLSDHEGRPLGGVNRYTLVSDSLPPFVVDADDALQLQGGPMIWESANDIKVLGPSCSAGRKASASRCLTAQFALALSNHAGAQPSKSPLLA